MNAESTTDPPPLLAIVYGSLSLEQPLRLLAESAEGIARILWVLPFDHRNSRAAIRLAKAQGEIDGDALDVSRMSPSEAAEVIRARHVQGITCFIDETLRWTADVAALLDLPFHSPLTADRLTDKLLQRTALADHGLPTPGFWKPEDLVADDALADTVSSAGFPLVLKPRRGTSSRDTEKIRTEEQLRRVVAAQDVGQMLLESYIPDPTTPSTGPGNAPYVSVEMLVSDGVASVLGVTGCTPLAEPFRETGQYFPADLTAEVRAAFGDAAIAAAHAMGITTGVLHVEVKWTDQGPVVIEVNGRTGGAGTYEFIRRSYGLNVVGLAMQVALGERIAFEGLPLPEDVMFRLIVQPDEHLRLITAVDGLDAARRIPGVERVTSGVTVGDAFSWRTGTLASAAIVAGVAADHDVARSIYARVLSTIKVEGTE